MPATNPIFARLMRRLLDLEKEIAGLRSFYRSETAAATTTEAVKPSPRPTAPPPKSIKAKKPLPKALSEYLEDF